MKNVISLCCGRPNCPKLTLPVIKGENINNRCILFERRLW